MSPRPTSAWSDFVDIATRLDSTINFTLVRFLYTVTRKQLSNSEIVLAAASLLLVVHTAGATAAARKHAYLAAEIAASLGSGLLGQALINSATSNERIVRMQLATSARLTEEFAVATCMLLLASVVPRRLQAKEYVARALTILLYMYTDATQNAIAQLNFAWSPPFLCGLLFVALQRFHGELARRQTLQYLVKALNMVSINILITSVSAVNPDAADLHTDTALLLLTLFLINSLTQFSDVFLESRNFAIWKGAQQLFLVYQELGVDNRATFALAVAVVLLHTLGKAAARLLWLNSNTLVEIFLLVVVNAIIDELATATMGVHNMLQAFTLFLYIIVIHATSLFFVERAH
jgi:hypothetical protein